MSVRDESFVLDGRIFWPPIDGEVVSLMNHHNHEHSDHVNGQQVNGEAMTEEELDAYEERLTNEAVLDQVKVSLHPLKRWRKTFFAAQELRVSLYHEFET